jgi:hypothetical protein
LLFVCTEEQEILDDQTTRRKLTLVLSISLERLVAVKEVEKEPLQFILELQESCYTFVCEKREDVAAWIASSRKPVIVKETKNAARTVQTTTGNRADKWGQRRTQAPKLNVVKKV